MERNAKEVVLYVIHQAGIKIIASQLDINMVCIIFKEATVFSVRYTL